MQNKKYQIFISSTFEDLQNERRDALEAILITKNIPIGMEAFVASSQKQFEYIKECINSCDYYILLVGGRYGTIHPEFNISYTELEFDYAKKLAESIGQSLYYAKKTGKKPAVAIILKKESDKKYVKRIKDIDLGLTIFQICSIDYVGKDKSKCVDEQIPLSSK